MKAMDYKHRQRISTLLHQHRTSLKDRAWKADHMRRTEEIAGNRFRELRNSVILPALEDAKHALTAKDELPVHVGHADGSLDDRGFETPDKAALVIAVREFDNPQIEFWGYRRDPRVDVYFQIVTRGGGTGSVRHRLSLEEVTSEKIGELVVEFLDEALPHVSQIPD